MVLPTVEQLLAMPLLVESEPEVVAGADQLGRPIRWLHPAEVPDIAHLLRGDEMVLTTGLFLSDRAGDLDHYVESLATAGVAGIILELGRRWSAAPSALIDSCEARAVVLIVLRREVSFAAVVEELGAQILDVRLDDLRASEHVHETFTRLDLEAASLQQILDAIVPIANAPVVLESSRGQVIGYHVASKPATAVLSDWTRRSRAVSLSGRTAYDQRSGWLVTVVSSRGDDWGRLVLMTSGLPSRRDYVLIERASASLALQQMRARVSDSLERNAHAVLLGELKSSRVSEELVMRCEAADLPVRSRQFFALAVQSRAADGTELPALSVLARALHSAGRALGIPMLVAMEIDHVIALISLDLTGDVDAVTTSLVREHSKSVDAVVAQGGAVQRLDEAGQSMIEAKSVLAAADPLDPRPWLTLANVHLQGLLHLLRDDERLHVFVRREMRDLLAHDRKRGTDLFSLLKVVLDTPGGKTAVAKRLLVSRPVLYERLAKLQAVMGLDLEDPRVRTSLHLAVMAREIIDDAPSGSIEESDSS